MVVRFIKKLEAMEEEIEGYILRAITDIARKCNTDNLTIIKIIKKVLTI